MSSEGNKNVLGKNGIIQYWSDQVLKLPFPFNSMRGMAGAKLFKCMKVCGFMDKGQKKLIGIKIRVNGYRLDFSVFSVAEISKLCCSGSLDFEREGDFLPKIQTIGNRRKRQMFFKNFPELLCGIHCPKNKKRVPNSGLLIFFPLSGLITELE